MELSFNVFWIVKLAFAVGLAFSIYMSVRAKFESYTWNVIWVVMFLALIFAPIRMEQSNLNRVHMQEATLIEEVKTLPEMVSDKSFADAVAKPKEITTEQIWKDK